MDARPEGPPDQQSQARRPYAPPAVSWEEDFMPYAFSTCGKMAGQGGACNAHRNS
jgi:hypothetical protein